MTMTTHLRLLPLLALAAGTGNARSEDAHSPEALKRFK
ncbi:hypothetical protein BDI4_10153 [Burkholderia diffusa]|nr:hypothetical protein BDI4_10153 [Burkholderia diffusa]